MWNNKKNASDDNQNPLPQMPKAPVSPPDRADPLNAPATADAFPAGTNRPIAEVPPDPNEHHIVGEGHKKTTPEDPNTRR